MRQPTLATGAYQYRSDLQLAILRGIKLAQIMLNIDLYFITSQYYREQRV